MAELVAGIGVPHSPHYPSQYRQGRAARRPPRLFREVKAHLDAARPDAIVIIANDHFNTFFMNNFPTFAIGVTEATFGPNDQTKMPSYEFKVQSALAEHMRKIGIEEGFDFSVTQEFGIDHAMLVPLHYLTDGIKQPVVPIWVNTFSAPLPTARRCYALGKMIRKARSRACRQTHARRGARDRQLLARDRRPEDRSRQAQQRARHRMVEAPAQAHRERRARRAGRGGDAGADVEGRQYRRRAAELDRAARRHRQGQAALLADHEEKDGHAYAAWRWN